MRHSIYRYEFIIAMGAKLSNKYNPVLPEHVSDTDGEELVCVSFGNQLEELPPPVEIVRRIPVSDTERTSIDNFRKDIILSFSMDGIEGERPIICFVKLVFISAIHFDDQISKLVSMFVHRRHEIRLCVVLDPDELLTLSGENLLYIRRKSKWLIEKHNIGIAFIVANPILCTYYGDISVCGVITMRRNVPLASALSYPVICVGQDLQNECGDQHFFAGVNSRGRSTIFMSKGNQEAYNLHKKMKCEFDGISKTTIVGNICIISTT